MLRRISTYCKAILITATASYLLLIFGAFDPWLDKARQKAMIEEGPAWASQAIGLNISEASVIDVEEAYGGWQGDGNRSARLQLASESAQTLLTQIQNNSDWEPEYLPCLADDKNQCTPVETGCYRYREETHSSETVLSSFCHNTRILNVEVILH